MWTYRQQSGELLRDADGSGPKLVSCGYSGFGAGKNNPAFENHAELGPIPRGIYTIGVPYDSSSHGPFVMSLNPAPANEMFGRSGFLLHGDSIEHPGSASHGCIIMLRQIRQQVWDSGDHRLEVVEG